MEHIIYSAIMIGFFVLTDLLPHMKDPNNDKKLKWFAIPAYAAALVINVLVGLGVPMASDPAVMSFLDFLTKGRG